MKSMEIKLPHDFNDEGVIKDYFNVTQGLACRMIEFKGWLRVDEARAMRMLADPRFNGAATREVGDVMDVSWHAKMPEPEAT